jgi:hypothetical protein
MTKNSNDGLHDWERRYLRAFAFMGYCAGIAFLLFVGAMIWKLLSA